MSRPEAVAAGPLPPRAGRSVAVSIVALVVAALAAALLVQFAVTFSGPPPMPAPVRLDAIAAALRTGSAPPGSGRSLFVADGRAPPRPHIVDRPNPLAADEIARRLGVPAAAVRAWSFGGAGDLPDELRGPFQIGWHRAPGDWRIAETAREPFFSRWHRVTLLAMGAVLAALSALACLGAGAISRPLRQVADAALAARAGAPLGTLPAGGAAEVRDLARAVATMHDRLQRHLEGRTAMLGAIAHDLGTPLSRLAFHVEQLPDAARTRAAGDIEEMRAMIAATLALARDGADSLAIERVELGALLDSLIDNMASTGAAVTLADGPRAVVRGDSGALRRLFGNLIGNALRYGGSAAVGWRTGGGAVVVTVDDRGPGLGGADPVRLFEPFVRGDPSRNRATGGTGLGLAIVRTLAEQHGGTATLADRPGGGARATVTLPCA